MKFNEEDREILGLALVFLTLTAICFAFALTVTIQTPVKIPQGGDVVVIPYPAS